MSLNSSIDQTPSYCQGGDFGSADKPKKLIQVRMHRRHCRQPGGERPPMIQGEDGNWAESVPARRLVTKVEPIHRSDPTPPDPEPPVDEGPPAEMLPDPPSWPPPHAANGNGSGNGYAPAGGGKLIQPATPPGAGELPPPPLTGITIKATQAMLVLYDYARQRGYIAPIDDFVDQAVRGYFRYVHKKTVAVIDME